MYLIEMLKDKTLRTRQRDKIYQGDHMESSIVFLLPEVYKDMSIRDSTVVLKYKTPDNHIGTEILKFDENLYQGMLMAIVPITKNITRKSGSVAIYLTIYNNQRGYRIRFKTTDAYLDILHKCQFVGELDNSEDIVDQLMDHLDEKIPDNLSFDPYTSELQLTSKDKPIGDKVNIDDKDEEWKPIVEGSEDDPHKDCGPEWEHI